MKATKTMAVLGAAAVLSATLQAGWVDVPFLRGDANRDGTVDLSDATAVLGYLFLEESDLEDHCMAAADSNDDGAVNITDAIYTLNFLFLGGDAPPAPFPAEDVLPAAADELDCQEYEVDPVPEPDPFIWEPDPWIWHWGIDPGWGFDPGWGAIGGGFGF